MPTDEQLNKLWETYTGYMGIPTNVRNQLSTTPTSEVESILSNTKNQITSDAVNKAQMNIAQLSSGMPQGQTADYLQNIGKGWDTISQMTGLKGVEQEAQQSADFLNSVAQRGTMFNQTMQGALMNISPTWLGANRDNVEQYFQFIPNVRIREDMIDNYLTAAKTSAVNTLNALKGLYDSALTAAQSAAENDQKKFNSIMDITKNLWTELAWIQREEYSQNTPQAKADLALTKAQTEKALNPVSTGTQTERDRIITSELIAKARPALEVSRQGGQFIDGNEFLRLRTDYAQVMGNTKAFDDAFQPLLSESDRIKYFKEYKPTVDTNQQLQDFLNSLSNSNG